MGQLAASAAVAAALLAAGCAGDDVESAPESAGSETAVSELPPDVVARVGSEDITKQEAQHWATAARTQGGCKRTKDCREQAMQFLVSSEWLLQHAEVSKVTATEKDIDRAFNKQKRQAFPREADYRKFLKESGRTEADLRLQVKLSVLTEKMEKAIGGRGKTQEARLDAFVAQFRRTYKRQTICRRAYSPKKQCGTIVD